MKRILFCRSFYIRVYILILLMLSKYKNNYAIVLWATVKQIYQHSPYLCIVVHRRVYCVSLVYRFFMWRRNAPNRQMVIFNVSNAIKIYVPNTNFSLIASCRCVSAASCRMMLLFTIPVESTVLVSMDSSDELPKIPILQMKFQL